MKTTWSLFQVTSQDKDDGILAGCTDGFDPCCNARIAFSHAYNQGGAQVLPKDYCKNMKDCSQIYSDCGGTTGPKVRGPHSDIFFLKTTFRCR